MFKKPYDSSQIGFFRVGKILLQSEMTAPTDVHSKCVILPDTYKPGTMDLDEAFLNPVPDALLKLMRPAKVPERTLSPEERAQKVFEMYQRIQGGNEAPTWIVISLLRPGSDK